MRAVCTILETWQDIDCESQLVPEPTTLKISQLFKYSDPEFAHAVEARGLIPYLRTLVRNDESLEGETSRKEEENRPR